MTNIRFRPYTTGFSHDSVDLVSMSVGVAAYWETKNKCRPVFVQNGARSSTYILEDATWHEGKIADSNSHTLINRNFDWGKETAATLEHIANTLNKWIRKHSEDELNALVRVLNAEQPTAYTDTERALLTEYKFVRKRGNMSCRKRKGYAAD